jgi:hypothetical protein
MAQPAADRRLHLIEARCATIRRLTQRLDNKCWSLERAIDRLGVDPWPHTKDQAEIAAGMVERWIDNLEANLCISDPKGGAQ